MTPLPPTLSWTDADGGRLDILDQTRLPAERVVLGLRTLDAVIDAIVRLAVRGAPAIGVAAAYGMVLGVRTLQPRDERELAAAVDHSAARLIAARPTAVNLATAVRRVQAAARQDPSIDALLDCAHKIHDEDRECCRAMARAGFELIVDGARILTHCNTGRLATTGDGTALALLFEAWHRGRRFQVLADETRPLLQGARLTALELGCEGIPTTVIADSAAAALMARGEVDLVLVGADRIAANGDVANKIGTYSLALAAAAHDIPFWVVAPHTTFDLAMKRGVEIPIEERDPAEILQFAGRPVAAPEVRARNPAFDVTPAPLLTGIVTDLGRIRPVTEAAIKALLAASRSMDHDHGRETASELAEASRRARLRRETREAGGAQQDDQRSTN